MPVSIGSELKLENNKVNAYYDNLFRKLNVAKAWTNTQTTESGGTVTVMYADGVEITNIESGYNDWFTSNGQNEGNEMNIIGGKLYRIHNGTMCQVGDKTNWKCCSEHSYPSANIGSVYAIDKSNKLFLFDSVKADGTYTSMTEVGSGIVWTEMNQYAFPAYAVGDGKLYKCTSGGVITEISSETGWTKISGYSIACGICNGYAYKISDTSVQLISTNNDFIDISSPYPYESYKGSIIALNSSGELYWDVEGSYNLEKSNFNHGKIKQMSNGSTASSDISVVTEDGKLYYTNSNGSWYELGSGINWTYTCSGYNNYRILAIGNGKLYKITPSTSGGTLTQIGSATGYKKVLGDIGTSSYNIIQVSLAWTGNATNTETTVYTTAHPQVGDKVYSDTNLTEYSTITAVSGTTITDQYRTYNMDVAKNSSFTNIPPATVHESVTVADILRATE